MEAWFERWFDEANQKDSISETVFFLDLHYAITTLSKYEDVDANTIVENMLNTIKNRFSKVKAYCYGDVTKDRVDSLPNGFIFVDTQDIYTYKRNLNLHSFLMLNHMYMILEQFKNTKSVVLCVGAAQFIPFIDFMKKQEKEVILMGIRSCFPGAFKKMNLECILYPLIPEKNIQNYFMNYIKNTIHKNNGYYPTFHNAVKSASQYFGMDTKEAGHILSKMIQNRYIFQKKIRTELNKEVSILECMSEEIEGSFQYSEF